VNETDAVCFMPEAVETERLILRLPTREDAAEINAALRETFDELHRWMEWAREVPALEETTGRVETIRSAFAAGEDYSYSAFLKGTNIFVVSLSIYTLDQGVPKYGIGYWCRRQFQGQGYVTESVRALTRLGFERLGANRLQITCDVNNTGSRRVAERSGFRLEATLENDMLTPDGALRTTAVYVCLPGMLPLRP
jgi:RimJ/RimL family protein N-acetyltransferase